MKRNFLNKPKPHFLPLKKLDSLRVFIAFFSLYVSLSDTHGRDHMPEANRAQIIETKLNKSTKNPCKKN